MAEFLNTQIPVGQSIDPFEDMYRGAKLGITSHMALVQDALDRASMVINNDSTNTETTDNVLSSLAMYMNLFADEIAIYRRCMAIAKQEIDPELEDFLNNHGQGPSAIDEELEYYAGGF